MAEVDEFFDVKNAFYLGNYQQCVNEATKLKVTSVEDQLTRDVFMYRAFLANKKYGVVKDEIKPSSHEHLKPLLILADYLSGDEKRKSKVFADLGEKFNTNSFDPSNVTFIIVAATIFVHESDFDGALRFLRLTDDLECLGMRVQVLLSIDRVDVAKKELLAMQKFDEDSTLTQLATAWCNIYTGGEKLREAFYIFQEMIDKYNVTPTLLNGQASAHIAQGQLDEAKGVLLEALDKDSTNPDTLINMIVISELQSEAPEVARRYLTQLKDSYPHHSYVKAIEQKENEFQRLVDAYA